MYPDFFDSAKLVAQYDPEVADAMDLELGRQRRNIELIASENFVSPAVMAAMGSVLTNKYAEGYPGKRYYGGCEYVDIVENLAIERAKELFGADCANVQPHSGAQANMAAYSALINPGDTVMGMSLAHGGHLTHGSPVNASGKLYKFVPYGVNDDGYIDYDELEKTAKEVCPKLIVAGELIEVEARGVNIHISPPRRSEPRTLPELRSAPHPESLREELYPPRWSWAPLLRRSRVHRCSELR